MCRLFGLTAGSRRVRATFWLLDAPDSLAAQSPRNPDGSGIGYFDQASVPVLDKQPEPAYRDPEFAREAKQAESSVFVAHVRLASAGGRSLANTHPFTMDGRIMAHNGGFGDLPLLEEELGGYRRLVLGETDSERYFALITRLAEEYDGDVATGITRAAGWIADNLPVSSLNAVVTMPGHLWALRYPAQHALHILHRPAGPGSDEGSEGMHVRSSTSSMHVPALQSVHSVVVASEALDGEGGWRMLDCGELVHVGPDLSVESAVVLPEPPRQLVPLPPGNPNIDT